MRVDGRLEAESLACIARSVRRQQADGYHTLWTSESAHDPFLPLAIAAEHSDRIRLGCAVAVAFARNPMTLAYTAHDLQTYSGGRLALGLGTQVRAHIERRFSMPWSEPTERIAEFITALRAILHSWEHREPLRFTGRFYRHTLMTPFFSPRPHGHGTPPILLAAVGTGMARVAGAVADGVLTHSVATPRYLTERVLPAVREGMRSTGRDFTELEVNCRGFVVTGRDETELSAAKDATRAQIAFYGSTPAYRPVFDLHGWSALATELHEISVSDDDERWRRMAELIDDTVLAEFAVIGEPVEIARQVHRRYGDIADSYRYYTPYPADPELLASVTGELASSGWHTDDEGSQGGARH